MKVVNLKKQAKNTRFYSLVLFTKPHEKPWKRKHSSNCFVSQHFFTWGWDQKSVDFDLQWEDKMHPQHKVCLKVVLTGIAAAAGAVGGWVKERFRCAAQRRPLLVVGHYLWGAAALAEVSDCAVLPAIVGPPVEHCPAHHTLTRGVDEQLISLDFPLKLTWSHNPFFGAQDEGFSEFHSTLLHCHFWSWTILLKASSHQSQEYVTVNYKPLSFGPNSSKKLVFRNPKP